MTILVNLGDAYEQLGNCDEAIRCLEQALTVLRTVDDRWVEGITLDLLGTAHHRLQRYDDAVEYYNQALDTRPTSATSGDRPIPSPTSATSTWPLTIHTRPERAGSRHWRSSKRSATEMPTRYEADSAAWMDSQRTHGRNSPPAAKRSRCPAMAPDGEHLTAAQAASFPGLRL
ncbi:tetratricopeptide repeat protein [Streptomyces sp. NPDC048172]|uniref:tetratricopeptide repeat protein n=1 Tax=Streptomyces sp. NPDC048172 TaxID=3365505 RepID=UPI0037233A8F